MMTSGGGELAVELDDDNFDEMDLMMLNQFENSPGVREKLVIGIDSGAAVTVCPEKVAAADYPVVEQGNGTWYRTAGGGRVAD
eukprot:4830671-Karenia_brevis.AAC.1